MSNIQSTVVLKLYFQTWDNIQEVIINRRHRTPQGQPVSELTTSPWNVVIGDAILTQNSPMVACSIQYFKEGPEAETFQWLRIWRDTLS